MIIDDLSVGTTFFAWALSLNLVDFWLNLGLWLAEIFRIVVYHGVHLFAHDGGLVWVEVGGIIETMAIFSLVLPTENEWLVYSHCCLHLLIKCVCFEFRVQLILMITEHAAPLAITFFIAQSMVVTNFIDVDMVPIDCLKWRLLLVLCTLDNSYLLFIRWLAPAWVLAFIYL